MNNKSSDIASKDYSLVAIEQLQKSDNFSGRSVNICKANGLITLRDLINFYLASRNKKGAFMMLRNCGELTALEIISICEKYIRKELRHSIPDLEEDYFLSNKIPDQFVDVLSLITLKHLHSLNKLSESTIEKCESAGLKNLKDIVEFCIEKGNFASIMKNDRPAELELENCSLRYDLEIIPMFFLPSEIQNPPDAEYINKRILIDEFRYYFDVNLFEIIPGLKSNLKDKKLLLFKVIDILFTHGRYFRDVEKEILKEVYCPYTTKHLDEIGQKFDLTRERVRQIKDHLRASLTYSGFFYGLLKILSDGHYEIPYAFSGDIICLNDKIFDAINHSSDTDFKNEFICFVLSKVNKDYSLIDKNMNENNFKGLLLSSRNWKPALNNFYFFKNTFDSKIAIQILKYLLSVINSPRNEDIIVTFENIMCAADTDFKTGYEKLLTKIGSRIEKQKEDQKALKSYLLNNLLSIVTGKSSAIVYDKNWNVIIPRGTKFTSELLSKIDLDNIQNFNWTADDYSCYAIETEFKIYNAKQRETIHLEESLITITREEFMEEYRKWEDVISMFCKNEFGVEYQNEKLTLKRNTRIKPYEYIIAVLKTFDSPMHIKELYAELNKQYPGIFKTEKYIDKTIQPCKEIFSVSPRTFGLKIWVNTKENIPHGSIRDMVAELLEANSKPLHFREILEYITKFRNTKMHNLVNNLKSEKEQNRFVFFPGSYLGLRSKNYEMNK